MGMGQRRSKLPGGVARVSQALRLENHSWQMVESFLPLFEVATADGGVEKALNKNKFNPLMYLEWWPGGPDHAADARMFQEEVVSGDERDCTLGLHPDDLSERPVSFC